MAKAADPPRPTHDGGHQRTLLRPRRRDAHACGELAGPPGLPPRMDAEMAISSMRRVPASLALLVLHQCGHDISPSTLRMWVHHWDATPSGGFSIQRGCNTVLTVDTLPLIACRSDGTTSFDANAEQRH